ncbi:phage virion morphogenesis protein [Ochrobactrum pseudogrignonense]|uniref:Phage virion morphogenesis protein n=1 Tax=Brucella pseudogrignonensis TaxID=419475 RepID=A0A7Y3WYX5_9HYPH|nr:phage virion morphogenesis protein [Brucella pseudogrignonensis]NNV22663.1 phage virion morphogenesis protein [Brucella pseudogrignonensis]
MTGISYKTTIDDADMREKLAELIGKMQRPIGFYKNVGERLLESVDNNFDNESAPDGTRWQGLSAVTRDRRSKLNGNAPMTILQVSGRLKESINYEASDTEVRIGSALVYAAIQHLGGESKGYMRGAVIPARPYLGISPADEEEIFAIAEDWLTVE